RADAHLVDAGDVLHSRAPEHALEVEHGVEPLALAARFVVALLEQPVEPAHPRARVAFERAQQMRRHRRVGLEVARAYVGDGELLEVERHAAAGPVVAVDTRGTYI